MKAKLLSTMVCNICYRRKKSMLLFWRHMKNTLIAIVGIVIVAGLGYTVFQRPSGTESVQTNVAANTTASNPSTEGQSSYVAGAYQDFSQSAYDAAIADGKTVILDFHADWCPTCRANEPIIKGVFEARADKNLVGFKVNYDTEIALKKTFNIQNQATLIKTSKNGQTKQLGPGPVTAESLTAFIQS